MSRATRKQAAQAAPPPERAFPPGVGNLRLGNGELARAGAVASRVAPAHRYVVITDQTVGALHLAKLSSGFGDSPLTIVIPPGEGEKNRARWAEITDRMLDAGCGRDTTVLALGGGVIGDLAGFVAATYMRGVPLVQVPTTLLAMVDASVGGKTAVDVPAGKNLVGAFHPAAAVVADPEVLQTLPVRHARSGVAEMLKHGAIADPGHFAAVREAAGPLAARAPDEPAGAAMLGLSELIGDSIAIKSAVVAEDPLETGRRRILNFGHTVAHALESASNFTLLHGEAVAIGMVLEARIAEVMGIARAGTAELIGEALRSVGLPSRLADAGLSQGISSVELRRWMGSDKKNQDGAIRFALPKALGSMEEGDGRWSVSVPESVIDEVLEKI